MDGKYESQLASLYESGAAHAQTISGSLKQMGAHGGLGALVVGMVKLAIPVVQKYILSVAQQVGKSLIERTIPENGHVLAKTMSQDAN